MLLGAAGCGGQGPGAGRVPGRILRIYASVPLDGPSAPAGRDVADGERLALVQAHGLAGRRRVRLVTMDESDPRQGGWTPAAVAANARRAAHDPTTIAYLGEVDPAASPVSVPILNQAGVLALSPTDSFAGLTRPEGSAAAEPAKFYPRSTRTFARLVPDDVVQAGAIVAWMRRVGVTRLALVHDDQLYGRSLAEEVARGAQRAGIAPVSIDSVPLPGSGPPTALVAKLGPLQPDAVFFGGATEPGVARVLNALRAGLGPVALFAPGGLLDPALLGRLTHSARAALHVTNPVATPSAASRPGRAFVRAFSARFRRTPTAYGFYGYEAMRVVLAGLDAEGARANTRADVIRAVLDTPRRAGVLGAYRFSPGGATTRHVIALVRPGAR